MSDKRRQFDRSFKLSAVRLLESSELPLEQVARELGITGSMLRRWRNQVRDKGEVAFSDSRARQTSRSARIGAHEERLSQKLGIGLFITIKSEVIASEAKQSQLFIEIASSLRSSR